MSYFSRLTDFNTFQRWALVETHRRGVEMARAVGAVTDGSEWCQSWVDFHRPDAVRILDFPHSGEHVAQIGQVVFGEGTPVCQTWLAEQLHQLKHDGPTPVLAEASRLSEAHPDRAELSEPLAYLTKREPHMHYPAFQAAGWPIGDGAVESGNKLVVEARLKGGSIGRGPMSIPCSRCGTSPATTAGKKFGPSLRVNSAAKPHVIASSVIRYGTPATKRSAG